MPEATGHGGSSQDGTGPHHAAAPPSRSPAGPPSVVVTAYDPVWPVVFARLRARLWPAVRELALAIEHIGSTAVPGLAAKPVIDMNIVLRPTAGMSALIERLAGLGYAHRGDLGIEGREAFKAAPDLPRHHLYASLPDGLGLANHLALRDYLRANPAAAARYGALKLRLAEEFPDDIDSYIDGKTSMVVEMLRQAGLSPEQLDRIARANRKTT